MIENVLSRNEFLKQHKILNPECVVISILNPGVEPFDLDILGRFKKARTFHFHDLEEDFANIKVISDEMAEDIRNYILENKNERFIVHCMAGQSRSAGTAKAIECLIKFNGNVYEYKTGYKSFVDKPGFFPNHTVFDKIVGVRKNDNI